MELFFSDIASGVVISGGSLSFYNGGTAISTTILSGGLLQTQDGTLSGTVISAGGTANIGAFTTVYATRVSAGGTDIAGGGTEFGTIIFSGGLQEIENAVVDSATVQAGGTQTVYNAAAASGTQLSGVQIINGGDALATKVASGATINVSYGITSGAILSSGALEIVSAGGTALATDVQSGAALLVLPGGTASGTTGTVISPGILIQSGGAVTIDPSAATVIGSGGTEFVISGTVYYAVLASGATQIIAGGTSFTTFVSSGAQVILDSGTADFSHISAGATLSVGSPVSSGGSTLIISTSIDGTASLFGGTAIATSVGFGGSVFQDAGTAISSIVQAGGIFYAAAATTSDTIVQAGGFAEEDFGTITSSTVAAGGTEYVYDGTDLAATVGGVLFVEAAAAYYGVPPGGLASGETVQSGGVLIAESGTTVSNVTVQTGGLILALSGATLSGVTGTVISTGIVETALGSAPVFNPSGPQTLSSGAVEYILTGSASATTVLSGAQQILFAGTTSGTVLNGGTAIISAGTAFNTVITAGGTEYLDAGTANNITLGGSSELSDYLGIISGALTFSGPGTVYLAGPGELNAATIAGFGAGDSIDLVYLDPYNAITITSSGNQVIVGPGTAAATTLTFAPGTAPQNFSTTPDMSGGTFLEVNPLCFTAGTRIATPRGERAIETLRIGDVITTATGPARILWLGHRSHSAAALAANADFRPIEFAAHSIAPNIPARTLRVSPGHGIAIGRHLIPASHLVNGLTIREISPPEGVHYIHIELAAHALVFAESCPAETFLDETLRASFDNAATAPHAPAKTPVLPRLESGFTLRRIQRRLAARAGLLWPEAAPAGRLTGFVERTHNIAAGWAAAGDSDAPVSLDIAANGVTIDRILANAYRPDLRRAGIGAGFHGFRTPLPRWATAITVHRTADGTTLPAERR